MCARVRALMRVKVQLCDNAAKSADVLVGWSLVGWVCCFRVRFDMRMKCVCRCVLGATRHIKELRLIGCYYIYIYIYI